MNWLVYFGGWAIGMMLTSLVVLSFLARVSDETMDKHPVITSAIVLLPIISWSSVWIWICWRFIQ